MTPSVSSDSTDGDKLPVTTCFAGSLLGVLNTLESTPASRSVSVGVHPRGPIRKREGFVSVWDGAVCAVAPPASINCATARATTMFSRHLADCFISLGTIVCLLRRKLPIPVGIRLKARKRPVQTVDQTPIRPAAPL